MSHGKSAVEVVKVLIRIQLEMLESNLGDTEDYYRIKEATKIALENADKALYLC